jgi:hypothetical protein
MDPDDPNVEVVPGGGGPGKEFASLSKHVLPAALYLVVLTLALLGLLIGSWPHCELDGCEAERKAAEATPAKATPTKAAAAGATPANPIPAETPPAPPGPAGAIPAQAAPAGAAPAPSAAERPAERSIEISTLEPTSGTVCGGTPVVITGSGFSQGAPEQPLPEVRFGGLLAPSISVGSDTSLIVTTPARWEGQTDVSVTIKGKSKELTKVFSYACPERNQGRILFLVVLAGMLGGTLHALRSLFWFTGLRCLRVSWMWMYYLLPLSGAAIAMVFFLVFIAGFFSPQGPSSQSFFVMVGIAALVGMFGQQAVEKLKKISEAVLTSVPPASDQTPKPLTLTEVKPSTGPTAGGTAVTLTGTGFMQGATVIFGGAQAMAVKVTGTQIDAVTPPHDAGKVDVEVCNPDSGLAKKVAAFQYLGPLSLTDIEPSTGSSTGNAAVVLSGDGFVQGATVTFGGVAATDVKVTSTQIDAKTPPHAAGKVEVEVRNPDGGTVKKEKGFEYKDDPASAAGPAAPIGGGTSAPAGSTQAAPAGDTQAEPAGGEPRSSAQAKAAQTEPPTPSNT